MLGAVSTAECRVLGAECGVRSAECELGNGNAADAAAVDLAARSIVIQKKIVCVCVCVCVWLGGCDLYP